MIEVLVVFVAGLVVIAAATVAGPRLGVASPLVLVAIGVAASFLPAFSEIHGTFDADVLAIALGNLDASQIAIEMRGRLAG